MHQYRRTIRWARGQLGHQYRLASRRGCDLDHPPAVDGGKQGDPVCRGRKSGTAIQSTLDIRNLSQTYKTKADADISIMAPT